MDPRPLGDYYQENCGEYNASTVMTDPSSFAQPLAQRLAPLIAILDVWSGSGRYRRWFRERGYNPLALEPSPTLVDPAPYLNDSFFHNMVADRVCFAVTRNFSRIAQVADIPYTEEILNNGSPIPRDFAQILLAEKPLRPGGSREIKLKINGSQYDALFKCPGPGREYRIVYDVKSDLPHVFRGYAGDQEVMRAIKWKQARHHLHLKYPGKMNWL